MLKNIFNFLFDKFKHYIYCVRGTLLCLGRVWGTLLPWSCVCSNIFHFVKAFFFYCLFPIIEIFQVPPTENYIQFHNSMGTHYCVQLLS